MASRRLFLQSALLLPSALSARPILLQGPQTNGENTAASERVDAFVRKQMETGSVPAVAIAVHRGGSPLLVRAYGLADRERNIPATDETPFRIASVSKQFFASAILVLMQEGRLALTDPVGQYIPGTPEAWKPITLRHLLSHTSGLVREGPRARLDRVDTDIDVIRSAFNTRLVFAPGTKWQYSNLGYFIIAEIIRVVSGSPWQEFIQKRIFAPSGMTRTTLTSSQVPDRATGYTYSDDLVKPVSEASMVALRPSGAFLSTVKDMAKWDAMLLGNSILDAKSRRLLWTPTPLNNHSTTPYGLGWSVASERGSRRVYHSGGQPGFRAYFLRGLDDGTSVVVLANSDKADVNALTNGTLRLYQSA